MVSHTPSNSMSSPTAMPSPVNSQTAMSLDESVSKPSKRSRTTCMKLRTTKSQERTIKFDAQGVPTGKNASTFASYYAFVAKEHVKITYTSWHLVPKELKDVLWNTVKKNWNIDSDKMKKKTLTTMGERWKGFKTMLRKTYIRNADPENPKTPCDDYNITEADWEEFKRQANTEKFKEMSLKGKNAASVYTHHHRLGAGGYKTAVQNWTEDDVLKACADSAGINSQFDSRSFKWLMARAKKAEDGSYFIPNEATRELLKLAESMVGSVGSLEPKQILSTVLGTPDHLGRLRGCSGWSTSSGVYGREKKRSSHDDCISKTEVNAILETELARRDAANKAELARREALTDARWELKMQNLFAQLNIPMVDIEMGQEAQYPTLVDSNDLAEQMLYSIQFDTPCNLFLLSESGERTMVAIGMLIPSKVGDKVDHQPLEPGQVKINIDDVLDGYRRWTVQFPLGDGTDRLGELKGNYLRWNASLVELCEKDITPSKPLQKRANTTVSSASSDNVREPLLKDIYLQSLGKQCYLLYKVLMAQPPDECQFDVPFFDFNYNGIMKMNLVDILEILKKDWVKVSIQKVFCMLAAHICRSFSLSNILFMDPELCVAANTEVDFNGMSSYITNFIISVKDASSFIFLPYLERVHWYLLIIQISGPVVYVVDSSNPEGVPHLEIKTALDTALRHYWMQHNRNKRGTRFCWTQIKGPTQPDGKQCGYYVMRSMYNIVNNYHKLDKLPLVLPPGPDHEYQDKEIDEVREMLAEFMRKII